MNRVIRYDYNAPKPVMQQVQTQYQYAPAMPPRQESNAYTTVMQPRQNGSSVEEIYTNVTTISPSPS